MPMLERPGLFRAWARSWAVRKAKDTYSVAINVEFVITHEHGPDGWIDWAQYDEYIQYGSFYVVKRDGAVNAMQVENLVKSLQWSGDLKAVVSMPPPSIPVQITVKTNSYKGRENLQVAWLNPGDYIPQPQSASPGEIEALQSQYGSLLRAAAASVVQNQGAAQAGGAGDGNLPPPPAAAPEPQSPTPEEPPMPVEPPMPDFEDTGDEFDTMTLGEMGSWINRSTKANPELEQMRDYLANKDDVALRALARTIKRAKENLPF